TGKNQQRWYFGRRGRALAGRVRQQSSRLCRFHPRLVLCEGRPLPRDRLRSARGGNYGVSEAGNRRSREAMAERRRASASTRIRGPAFWEGKQLHGLDL